MSLVYEVQKVTVMRGVRPSHPLSMFAAMANPGLGAGTATITREVLMTPLSKFVCVIFCGSLLGLALSII